MSLNIEFQCAGLVILIIVLALFIRTKKLKITNSRLFFLALLSCFLCEILDIGSIIAIYHSTYGELPSDHTDMICKLYLMSLVLQGYQGFEYASSEILASNRRKWLRILYRIVFIVGELMIAITDIGFFMDGRIVYSYGPAAIWTYVIAVIFILSTIIMAIVGQDSIPLRRRKAMLVWQGCWLAAASLQFAKPELLLVGFAAAVGMMILYSELENPNEYLDRETGCFTRSALTLYLKDKYIHNERFSVFVVRIGFLIDADYELEKSATMRVSKAILALGKEPVFYLDEGRFAVVYSKRKDMERKFLMLHEMANRVTDVPAEGKYIVVPDSSVFESSEELLHFIHTYEYDISEEIVANEASVVHLRKDVLVHDMIDSALKEDRIEVYYQPFFNVSSRKFTAAEALVRIRDAEGKLIPPAEFIPVAERSGQIRELGNRIFEKVCIFLE
ncbi:MAG: EAL domain-containing protein, partial [Lachnospiraceae bacterium]|nr:EAL domain-containing protein [Lachnospiraceae bacterium]